MALVIDKIEDDTATKKAMAQAPIEIFSDSEISKNCARNLKGSDEDSRNRRTVIAMMGNRINLFGLHLLFGG